MVFYEESSDLSLPFWILFIRIPAFETEVQQMGYSGAKDISDVPQELDCLFHWINLQFLLMKQMTVWKVINNTVYYMFIWMQVYLLLGVGLVERDSVPSSYIAFLPC